MGTCCGTICKHRILFPSIQHLAWLPQERPQGKRRCGKNSKNINLRRYFKFNREANCNNSIQTFICPMCTATLCNLCYIVVCCELLVHVFWQKVLQYLNNLSAIAELLVSLSQPVNPKHKPCTCRMMLRCFWPESEFWLWIHKPKYTGTMEQHPR